MSSCRTIRGLALATVLVMPAASIAQSACWSPDNVRAAHIHAFKTMMLVTALQCRSRVPETLEGYNAFVRARGVWLGEQEARLRAHHAQERGVTAGLLAAGSYETSLGNRFAAYDPDWRDCRAMVDDIAYAAAAPPEEIARMGSALVAPGIVACRAADAPPVTVAEVAVMAPPSVAPAAAAAFTPDDDDLAPPLPPTVPVGRVDPDDSAVQVAAAAKETAVAAADPSVPPSAADALANAAKALAAAAEAMRSPSR